MTGPNRLTRHGKKGRRKVGERYSKEWEQYLEKYKPNEYAKYKSNLKYESSDDKYVKTHKPEYEEFKKGSSCAICGYSVHMESLDFHHIEPNTKKFHITYANWTRDDFMDELNKCMCLCSNCHRHITKIEKSKIKLEKIEKRNKEKEI